MPKISHIAILFISITFLVGCAPVKKESYLLDDPVTWYIHQAGDKDTYAYLNLENEQFGEASYTWSQPSSEQTPTDLNNISYLVEENNFDTQADGFFRARFFGQTEDGSLILYGFRTKKGTYWIKNTEDNSYGIDYLPTSIDTDEDATNVDGTIIQCNDLICSNVGNIGLVISYNGLLTKTTPLAVFETYQFEIVGNLDISTEKEVNLTSFIEWLSIYPPLGVVHRILDLRTLNDAIYVEMKLSNTYIDTSTFTKDLTIE